MTSTSHYHNHLIMYLLIIVTDMVVKLLSYNKLARNREASKHSRRFYIFWVV